MAARGLAAAQGVGVLTGGRLTLEDAYAYAKFARVALGTNDIDFRARAHSPEETDFLASTVAGSGLGVTFGELERVGKVVLVGLEPEDEAGTVFLRLRKASGKGLEVFSIAPHASRGLHKMHGTLIRTAPGAETAAVEALAKGSADALGSALDGGDVILVGERLAAVPGALSAVVALAGTTGARLAWVPRRAGDRGAVEAGCLPTTLPGGRPVADAAARVDMGTVWGTTIPHAPGRDADAIVAAAAAGELGALVVAGALGIADVFAVDVSQYRLELAGRLGATPIDGLSEDRTAPGARRNGLRDGDRSGRSSTPFGSIATTARTTPAGSPDCSSPRSEIFCAPSTCT